MGKIVRMLCIGAFLIAAIIASISLPRRDLRTIAQVAGIALDEEKGRIRATFELYVPNMDQPFGKEREMLYVKGNTIKECVENVKAIAGKELYTDDAAVLIVEEKAKARLLAEIKRYYCVFANDHMDLPILFAHRQQAGKIFEGKGKILSAEIAESVRLLQKRYTIRDALNGSNDYVYIRGEGDYEIIS